MTYLFVIIYLFIIYLCFDIIGSIVFVWFMLRQVARCAL